MSALPSFHLHSVHNYTINNVRGTHCMGFIRYEIINFLNGYYGYDSKLVEAQHCVHGISLSVVHFDL